MEITPDHLKIPSGVSAYQSGLALAKASRLAEAAECFLYALTASPRGALAPDAYNNLGVVRGRQGDPVAAAEAFRQALKLRPGFVEAWFNLAFAEEDRGQWQPAVEAYRQVLRLRPGDFATLLHLGGALGKCGRLDEAVDWCRRAVGLRPGDMAGHGRLGQALEGRAAARDMARDVAEAVAADLDAAEGCYRAAVAVGPDQPEGHMALGLLLRQRGRPGEALACFEQAIALRPRDPEAHLGKATVLLAAGEWGRGWEEYEWRHRRKADERPMEAAAGPLWDGSPLAGRVILLQAEQGLGDTIQFFRFVCEVAGRNSTGADGRVGKVVLRCHKGLASLLRPACRRLAVDVFEGEELPATPPPADTRAPLLSLPRILGTTLDTLPAPRQYLSADPVLVERWRRRLEAVASPGRWVRVGIAWQGNAAYALDRYRSIPPTCFTPLATTEGVRLVGLQKKPCPAPPTGWARRVSFFDLGGELDTAGSAFVDTAAVMMNLDLVITSDTSLAHLAGALGVPVWVALSAAPDWRWLRGREDSPWYPTMRLFRQARPGDWGEVFGRMADRLRGEREAALGGGRAGAAREP